MEYLAIRSDLLKVVANVSDKSSEGTMRVLIELHNGYKLSVIAGRGAYARGTDSYEVAAWKGNGDMDGSLLGCEHDDVIGHQSYQDVMSHLNTLSRYTN